MSAKNGKIISIAQKRALRDTFAALHTPATKEVIYDGALAEFKRLISPQIRRLLEIKNTPEPFQRELVTLLEKIYASEHADPGQAQRLVPTPKVNQK